MKCITFQPIQTAAGILKPAHPQEPLWTVDSGSGVPRPVVSLAHFHPALLSFLLLSVLGLPHSLSAHSSSPHQLPVHFLSHRCFLTRSLACPILSPPSASWRIGTNTGSTADTPCAINSPLKSAPTKGLSLQTGMQSLVVSTNHTLPQVPLLPEVSGNLQPHGGPASKTCSSQETEISFLCSFWGAPALQTYILISSGSFESR